MQANDPHSQPPSKLGLFVPLILVTAALIFEQVAPQSVVTRAVNENGAIELAQFALIVVSGVLAGWGLVYCARRGDMLLTFWLFAGTLGCLYIAGEEISWGQHFFGWGTPDSWKAINDQGETNLHNTSAWLDQKPRLLLELGVLFGGLIAPLAERRGWFHPAGRLRTLLPPHSLWPMAAAVVLVKLFDKLGEAAGVHLLTRPAEYGEAFLYLYLGLYFFATSRQR